MVRPGASSSDSSWREPDSSGEHPAHPCSCRGRAVPAPRRPPADPLDRLAGVERLARTELGGSGSLPVPPHAPRRGPRSGHSPRRALPSRTAAPRGASPCGPGGHGAPGHFPKPAPVRRCCQHPKKRRLCADASRPDGNATPRPAGSSVRPSPARCLASAELPRRELIRAESDARDSARTSGGNRKTSENTK